MTSQFSAEALEARVLLSTATLETFASRLGYDLPMLNVSIAELGSPEQVVGFGQAIAVLGDVNNDGVPDFAISSSGQPSTPGPVSFPGAIVLFSGADGSEIARVIGDQQNFARQLFAIGDANSDGVPDVVAVSRDWTDSGQSEASGRVAVYSGVDLSMLWEVTGTPGERFGWDAAVVPDVDGDGADEVAVGVPFFDSERGKVDLLNGADGAVIDSFPGTDDRPARMGLAVESTTLHGGYSLFVSGVPESFSSRPLTAYWLGVDAEHRFIVLRGHLHKAYEVVQNPPSDFEVWPILNDVAVRFMYNGEDEGVGVDNGLLPTGSGMPRLRYDRPVVAIGDLNADGTQELLAVAYTGSGSTLYTAPHPLVPATIATQNVDGTRNSGHQLEIGQPGAFSLNWISAHVFGDWNDDGFDDIVAVTPNGFAIHHGIGIVPPGQRLGFYDEVDVDDIIVNEDSSAGYFGGGFFWADPIVFRDGEFERLSEGHELRGLDPIAVMPDGSLVGHATDGSGFTEGTLLIEQNGALVPFSSLVTQVVGGSLNGLRFVQVVPTSDDGFILGAESPTEPTQTVWSFQNGVLALLWEGELIDATDNGWAVGTLSVLHPTMPAVTVLRSPAGLLSFHPEVFGAGGVNRAGTVAGFNSADNLVYLRDGELSIASTDPFGLYWFIAPARWDYEVIDINDDDYILLGFPQPSEGVFIDATLYRQDIGLLRIGETIAASHSNEDSGGGRFAQTLRVDGSTLVTTIGLVDIGLADFRAFRASPELPIGAAASRQQLYLGGHDQYGRQFSVIRRSGGLTFGQAYRNLEPRDAPRGPFVAWYDELLELTGVAFSRYASSGGSSSGSWNSDFLYQDENGFSANFGRLTDLVDAEQVSVMRTPGGVSVVSTFHPDGRVGFLANQATLSVPGPSARLEFIADGIDWQDGTMTSYATAWGGLNIAGLNAEGEVEVVWTAPGLDGWRTDNLSQIAGAPKLVGNISAFVTPWRAVHIVGTDEQGNMQVLWWSPALGAGNWRTDDLTGIVASNPDGVSDPIAAGSLTAYVTPWNGLNIAARTTTGELVAYWWTPTTRQWVAQRYFDPADGPVPGDLPVGALTSAVSPNGELTVAGLTAEGDITRLWWSAQTRAWQVENLSALARGESA